MGPLQRYGFAGSRPLLQHSSSSTVTHRSLPLSGVHAARPLLLSRNRYFVCWYGNKTDNKKDSTAAPTALRSLPREPPVAGEASPQPRPPTPPAESPRGFQLTAHQLSEGVQWGFEHGGLHQ